jgi:hypothetical protein
MGSHSCSMMPEYDAHAGYSSHLREPGAVALIDASLFATDLCDMRRSMFTDLPPIMRDLLFGSAACIFRVRSSSSRNRSTLVSVRHPQESKPPGNQAHRRMRRLLDRACSLHTRTVHLAPSTFLRGICTSNKSCQPQPEGRLAVVNLPALTIALDRVDAQSSLMLTSVQTDKSWSY